MYTEVFLRHVQSYSGILSTMYNPRSKPIIKIVEN